MEALPDTLLLKLWLIFSKQSPNTPGNKTDLCPLTLPFQINIHDLYSKCPTLSHPENSGLIKDPLLRNTGYAGHLVKGMYLYFVLNSDNNPELLIPGRVQILTIWNPKRIKFLSVVDL